MSAAVVSRSQPPPSGASVGAPSTFHSSAPRSIAASAHGNGDGTQPSQQRNVATVPSPSSAWLASAPERRLRIFHALAFPQCKLFSVRGAALSVSDFDLDAVVLAAGGGAEGMDACLAFVKELDAEGLKLSSVDELNIVIAQRHQTRQVLGLLQSAAATEQSQLKAILQVLPSPSSPSTADIASLVEQLLQEGMGSVDPALPLADVLKALCKQPASSFISNPPSISFLIQAVAALASNMRRRVLNRHLLSSASGTLLLQPLPAAFSIPQLDTVLRASRNSLFWTFRHLNHAQLEAQKEESDFAASVAMSASKGQPAPTRVTPSRDFDTLVKRLEGMHLAATGLPPLSPPSLEPNPNAMLSPSPPPAAANYSSAPSQSSPLPPLPPHQPYLVPPINVNDGSSTQPSPSPLASSASSSFLQAFVPGNNGLQAVQAFYSPSSASAINATPSPSATTAAVNLSRFIPRSPSEGPPPSVSMGSPKQESSPHLLSQPHVGEASPSPQQLDARIPSPLGLQYAQYPQQPSPQPPQPHPQASVGHFPPTSQAAALQHELLPHKRNPSPTPQNFTFPVIPHALPATQSMTTPPSPLHQSPVTPVIGPAPPMSLHAFPPSYPVPVPTPPHSQQQHQQQNGTHQKPMPGRPTSPKTLQLQAKQQQQQQQLQQQQILAHHSHSPNGNVTPPPVRNGDTPATPPPHPGAVNMTNGIPSHEARQRLDRSVVLAALSFPRCKIFSNCTTPVRITDRHLDTLIEEAGHVDATVTLLRTMEKENLRVDSADALLVEFKSLALNERREELVSYLLYPRCTLFTKCTRPIEIEDEDLDRVMDLAGSVALAIKAIGEFEAAQRKFFSFAEMALALESDETVRRRRERHLAETAARAYNAVNASNVPSTTTMSAPASVSYQAVSSPNTPSLYQNQNAQSPSTTASSSHMQSRRTTASTTSTGFEAQQSSMFPLLARALAQGVDTPTVAGGGYNPLLVPNPAHHMDSFSRSNTSSQLMTPSTQNSPSMPERDISGYGAARNQPMRR